MDPQTCTIILLKQTNPFYISDHDDISNHEESESDILQKSFGNVHKDTSIESCLNYIKLLPSSSTLLLVELDDAMENQAQLQLVSQTIELVSDAVPVIVYSTRDDPQFMLECIQVGAADYVLKPLRPDVIKTLFLTLVRRQHQQQSSPLYQDHLISCSTISTITSVMSPITPTMAHHCSAASNNNNKNSAYLPERIQDRIKALNARDINFTKAIIDSYIPSQPSAITCKQLTNEHEADLRKKISSWDFSPLSLSHDDLVHCSVLIISQVFLLNEVTEFRQDQLYSFILDLASIYHDENPYHNFAHAVDVLQCIYYFTCQLGLVPFADGTPRITNSKTYRILRPRDIFALFIAAIGHDTAHPGVNNAFLINTSAPLALLYNDNSVLESFHAMTLFQLLKKHKFNDILGGSDSKEYNEFRKLVITSILATDMALHGDYVTKIKEQKQRLADSDPTEWDAPRCLEERLLFCSGLIKCADISNVARPFPRAFEWAQILVEEFASQGDLERELGLSVIPMNDRSQIVLEDSQIGFIRYVAVGLFESVSEYMQDHIKRNLSIWEDRKRENIENNHEKTTQQHEQQRRQDSNSGSDTTATDEEYHAQAVAALAKKSDLDSGYTLPAMPTTLAMSSLLSMAPKRYPDEHDHQGEWDHHESAGPVYCSYLYI
ncbi:hypothetical protein [Parasitella parasitica]|uniref:Phosphodiesterase n=1 Tax=Parasitella parasitica TaxID=35722 RepID=A0A0B7NVZ2_9FUNG|nr:hypothetical protein [Parasitella parasitica]